MSDVLAKPAASASEYQYDYTLVPPLAMAASVPDSQKPKVGWLVKVGWTALQIVRNQLTWKWQQAQRQQGKSSTPAPAEALRIDLGHLGLGTVDLSKLAEHHKLGSTEDMEGEGVLERLKGEVAGLEQAVLLAGKAAERGLTDPLELLGEVVKAVLEKPQGRPQSMQDYVDLFTTLPLPWAASSYQEDATFAWMQVAGFNPLVLRKVKALDASFPVTEAQAKAALGSGDSLQQALAEGRAYVADYSALAKSVNGNFPVGPKYGFAPKALFVLPQGTGPRQLVPVAIQCGQDPRSYPVYTRADGEAWQQAKVVVMVASFNHHEMVSHLGHTHLLVEPFVVATHRQLPDEHPVSLLLRPHFEGTLNINNMAQAKLIAPGGQVDKLLAGTIDSSKAVAVASLIAGTFDFNSGMLPKELEARGVTEAGLEYPYRDDALLVWGAIERWVKGYVGLHYKKDEDVQGDAALQAWSQELVAENGGRVRGFGEDGKGKLTTVAYLEQALTMLIFTASAQHAAVNFAQAGLMTFTPLAPGAAYRAAPLSVADTALNPALDQFPPMDMAALQLDFLTLLGSVYYTKLGDYRPLWFKDLRVLGKLREFQKELAEIGQEIQKRNEKRYGPYPYLIPEYIPQSINI